jgi:acyl-CoA synthetase (NDP forming)
LLQPARVAVVGVSADPSKHGARVVNHLHRLGYAGEIWAVNPKRPRVAGAEVTASLADLPHPPDVVVSAVPSAATVEVVRMAGEVGAAAVVVFAGGFAEAEGGARLQAELVETARAAGIRVLGPNSGGVIRPVGGVALSFLTCLDRPAEQIRPGRVGLVTQSGGTGSYLHNLAAARGGGLAASISTGNEADIDAAEAIQALVELDDVGSVAVVLESVRHGPRFLAALEAARARGKPVVVCRLGISERGGRMLSTHTGAMAQPAAVLDGVLDAHGASIAETPEEMLDVADVLAVAPAATGDRVAVVTHSGGLAILIADLAARGRLHLPMPGPELQEKLAPLLDLGAAGNPLDMGAIMGGPGRFAEVTRVFLESGEYDTVLAVTSAHPPAHSAERVTGLLQLPSDKPLIHLWMAGDLGAAGLASLREAGRPTVCEPRAAVLALSAIGRRAALAAEPDSGSPEVEPSAGTTGLDPSYRLLVAWGIPVVDGELVSSAREASAAAGRLGPPVVVKVSSPDIVHKARLGAVVVDVPDGESAAGAYDRVMKAVGAGAAVIDGVLVQRYRPGPEAIIGAVVDDTFGPVVLAGVGGALTEALGAVAMAPAPVTPAGAARLLHRSGADRLLAGDSRPDFAALAELVSRLSHRFAAQTDEFTEVEVNPIIWTGQSWEAADAVVRGRRPADG